MRKNTEEGNYNGFRVLLSSTVSLYYLARYFTVGIRTSLQLLYFLLILVFAVSICSSTDRMKQNGYRKKPIPYQLIWIPTLLLLLWLRLSGFPIWIQSILSGAAIAITLHLQKPKRKEELHE